MKFSDLNLCKEITDAVLEKGYTVPTPIQEQVIPHILAGKDVMAAAQTGTGKTAGFVLPILDLIHDKPAIKPRQVRALILTPTRELAAQVDENVQAYGAKMNLSTAVVFGGVTINRQKQRLSRGVDILVATPGRLLDLYNQKMVAFSQLEIFVLDEADRMLDMGFIKDIRKIMTLLPIKRQTLLFSATFSKVVRELAKGIVQNPIEVSVTPPNSTVEAITQIVYPVEKKEKPLLLEALIKEGGWAQVLVFCRTKHGTDKLTRILNKKGIKAAAIHGDKRQGARTRALEQFKALKINVLVATDIAARGLDIDQLPHVVNFDLPNLPEDYVHRIGRTGRAGAKGHAVSLVCLDEFEYLVDIEQLIQQIIPRQTIEGAVSHHELPASSLEKKPFFKKKKQAQTKGKKKPYMGKKSGGNRYKWKNSK